MDIKKIQTNSIIILRVGLALVFLAHFYIAVFNPDEFVNVINGSFLPHTFINDPDLLVKLIAISDVAVAVLLLFGFGLKYISAYASLWILGVIVVSGIEDPPDFFEHLGFLSIAVFLFLNYNNKT